jgi:hypothetical protein
MCEGTCLVKTIAMADSKYCEVDVCSICGAKYPRGKIIGGDDKDRKHRECKGR